MSYIKKWEKTVVKHHKQSESKILHKQSDDFWEDKVEGFIPPELPDFNDSTLSFLRTHLSPDSSVLDLGGGAGRLSIPLAQKNHAVTIVDSSKAMIMSADKHYKYLGLKNVSTYHSPWEEFENNKYDYIICAHVIYGVANIKKFIEKIKSSINRNAIIIMYNNYPQSHISDIWELYYQEQRINLPGITELRDVIEELDIEYKFYNIEEFDLPTFDNFDSMLESISSQMFLDRSNKNIEKLTKILKNYMVVKNEEFVFPLKAGRKLQAIIL